MNYAALLKRDERLEPIDLSGYVHVDSLLPIGCEVIVDCGHHYPRHWPDAVRKRVVGLEQMGLMVSFEDEEFWFSCLFCIQGIVRYDGV